MSAGVLVGVCVGVVVHIIAPSALPALVGPLCLLWIMAVHRFAQKRAIRRWVEREERKREDAT